VISPWLSMIFGFVPIFSNLVVISVFVAEAQAVLALVVVAETFAGVLKNSVHSPMVAILPLSTASFFAFSASSGLHFKSWVLARLTRRVCSFELLQLVELALGEAAHAANTERVWTMHTPSKGGTSFIVFVVLDPLSNCVHENGHVLQVLAQLFIQGLLIRTIRPPSSEVH